eukprot:767883-Hanusia_phi.AAC.4
MFEEGKMSVVSRKWEHGASGHGSKRNSRDSCARRPGLLLLSSIIAFSWALCFHQVQGAAIAEYYWDDIAQCNEASGEAANTITVAPQEVTQSVQVTERFLPVGISPGCQLIKTIPKSDSEVADAAEPCCWVIHGHQRVSKFKEHVRVEGGDGEKEVLCWRVRECEVVVCCSQIPSLDSDVVLHLNRPIEIMPNSRKVLGGSAEHATVEQSGDAAKDGEELFLAILHSLRVKDWGLFSST